MPTPKGENPKIFVGETTYLPVDIDNLVIKGSTTKKLQPISVFTDGQHHSQVHSSWQPAPHDF